MGSRSGCCGEGRKEWDGDGEGCGVVMCR
jgi:hypothetical protein